MKSLELRWYTIASIVCIAFVVGAAASAVFFWSSSRPSELDSTALSPTQEDAGRAANSIDSNPDAANNTEPTGNFRASSGSLASVARLDDEFDRILALYQHLAELDKEQLVDLIHESEQLDSDTRLDIQRALFQRLTSLDPLLAFSHAQKLQSSLMTTVFNHWSVSDLNEAIEHAKTLDPVRQSAALQGILKSRHDLPEGIRLQIGGELNNEGLAQSIIKSSRLDEYLKTPGESWRAIIGDAQYDAAQLGMLHTLARTWFEQEGLPVIEHIINSMQNEEARASILSPVLHMAVTRDPQATFDLALNLKGDIDNTMVSTVAHIWASRDPLSAFQAAQVVERVQLREQLMTSIMSSWAEDDPHSLLENLDHSSDRMLNIGLELAIREIAQDSPHLAAPLLARMADGPRKRDVAHAVAINWLHFEPNVALDWILNDRGLAEYRQNLLRSVLPTLAVDSPQLAFDTALAQPLEGDKPGLEVAVISVVAPRNLDLALEMLPQVREGTSKRNAYLGMGSMMVAEGSPMRAVELSQQLPESDRETYFLMTMATWSQSDPEGLLGTIDRLPSPAAKSKAAAILTLQNKFEKKLTEEQIEQASKFLSEKDAKSLEEGGMSLLNPLMELGME